MKIQNRIGLDFHAVISISFSISTLKMFSNAEEVFRHSIRQKKFGRRVARGNPELSVPQSRDLQTNNCFPLLATGGPPGVIQRRGVGRQRRKA